MCSNMSEKLAAFITEVEELSVSVMEATDLSETWYISTRLCVVTFHNTAVLKNLASDHHSNWKEGRTSSTLVCRVLVC